LQIREIFLALLSLVGAVGILVFLVFFSRRLKFNSFGRVSGKYMSVVDRVAFGPDSSISIVKIGPRYYIACVSGNNVTLRDLADSTFIDEVKSNSRPYTKWFPFTKNEPRD
jgi:flagellar biogenesis protein FliO